MTARSLPFGGDSHILDLRVAKNLVLPAVNGLLLRRGKSGPSSTVPAHHGTCYTWTYERDQPRLAKLTRQARAGQWDPDVHLDWNIRVDAQDPEVELFDEASSPLAEFQAYRNLPLSAQREHRAAMLAWMMSQFLHGEQGALFAACQITESIAWYDAKLYGATQVADEGRHVEVFQRYLDDKLQRRYAINDNLYVILESLSRDPRWDLKFLGMQILVEGLALGAFGTLRLSTKEPLLRELLRLVIMDEARHVHFGVVALERFYSEELPEAERREREDWAYEMCVLMRNRFLAHEYYEEYWAHAVSRREWDRISLQSTYMRRFRHTMFRRLVPNLRRIGLMTDRVRSYYEKLGLLEWEKEKAAPELTADDLLAA